MEDWTAHQLFQAARASLGQETARAIQKYAQQLQKSGIPVVFDLRHLSKIVDTDYSFLTATVRREREASNYKLFAISKRAGGKRLIHQVSGKLQAVHRFINSAILQKIEPHNASYAFHKSGGIKACAEQHCGARWLFKFDLENFFYSVGERDVFHIFRSLGYQSLLAFELARLCTTTNLPRNYGHMLQRITGGEWDLPYSRNGVVGVLPQGAASSPMLANLAGKALDDALSNYSVKNGFVYTRYADDLTLSCTDLPAGTSIAAIQRSVVHCIRNAGFKENPKKTIIAGPGTRKSVLGLLVDGPKPRLPKETFKRIDRHLYVAKKFGIEEAASYAGFDSAFGFHNHLQGLVAYTKDVDSARWSEFQGRLSSIAIPWN